MQNPLILNEEFRESYRINCYHVQFGMEVVKLWHKSMSYRGMCEPAVFIISIALYIDNSVIEQ